MAHVSIQVNGRKYDIGCDDGEEEHVRGLALELDRRVGQLAASVGQVGDARLLILTGLLLADELADCRSVDPPVEVPPPSPAAQASPETDLSSELKRLASRIEACAARLSAPAPVVPPDEVP